MSTLNKEEREALLSSEKGSEGAPLERLPGPVNAEPWAPPARGRLHGGLGRLAVALNLLCFAYLTTYLVPWSIFQMVTSPSLSTFRNEFLFDGDTVRSNGTHDYKRTVLLVSIDGLRWVAVCYWCSYCC